MYVSGQQLTLPILHHWLPHLQQIALVESSLESVVLWFHPPLYLLEWSEDELDCILPARGDCWLEWKKMCFSLGIIRM